MVGNVISIVTIQRILSTEDGTFGVMSLNQRPLCVTLEDKWNNNQNNISCIPAGRYNVVKYSGTINKNVWKIMNVPNRSDVLIHTGNTNNDTEGCVLVGEKFGMIGEKSAVLSSGAAMKGLRGILPSTFVLIIKDCV